MLIRRIEINFPPQTFASRFGPPSLTGSRSTFGTDRMWVAADARGVKYRSELADESGDGVRAGGRSVVGGEGEAVGRR
jgi:hypothetical protein